MRVYDNIKFSYEHLLNVGYNALTLHKVLQKYLRQYLFVPQYHWTYQFSSFIISVIVKKIQEAFNTFQKHQQPQRKQQYFPMR